MEVIVVPGAEAQIRTIDDWWRENRTAAPELFVQELAAAVALIQSSPQIGRQRPTSGPPWPASSIASSHTLPSLLRA